ncbi:putative DNA repair and recombination protein RAD54B [Planoprotostelium fungivorum]|uniref:Putative DNA repair and recombination protein RAD54B n=1 Tax=Planoprotostelium fungivorum TaxID=1890364 RepID=A0A2P6NFW9_9EUKA|nr:putative DNA repair and recombination protein RAD54B [Planoprotostelium fungivorum]
MVSSFYLMFERFSEWFLTEDSIFEKIDIAKRKTSTSLCTGDRSVFQRIEWIHDYYRVRLLSWLWMLPKSKRRPISHNTTHNITAEVYDVDQIDSVDGEKFEGESETDNHHEQEKSQSPRIAPTRYSQVGKLPPFQIPRGRTRDRTPEMTTPSQEELYRIFKTVVDEAVGGLKNELKNELNEMRRHMSRIEDKLERHLSQASPSHGQPSTSDARGEGSPRGNLVSGSESEDDRPSSSPAASSQNSHHPNEVEENSQNIPDFEATITTDLSEQPQEVQQAPISPAHVITESVPAQIVTEISSNVLVMVEEDWMDEFYSRSMPVVDTQEEDDPVLELYGERQSDFETSSEEETETLRPEGGSVAMEGDDFLDDIPDIVKTPRLSRSFIPTDTIIHSEWDKIVQEEIELMKEQWNLNEYPKVNLYRTWQIYRDQESMLYRRLSDLNARIEELKQTFYKKVRDAFELRRSCQSYMEVTVYEMCSVGLQLHLCQNPPPPPSEERSKTKRKSVDNAKNVDSEEDDLDDFIDDSELVASQHEVVEDSREDSREKSKKRKTDDSAEPEESNSVPTSDVTEECVAMETVDTPATTSIPPSIEAPSSTAPDAPSERPTSPKKGPTAPSGRPTAPSDITLFHGNRADLDRGKTREDAIPVASSDEEGAEEGSHPPGIDAPVAVAPSQRKERSTAPPKVRVREELEVPSGAAAPSEGSSEEDEALLDVPREEVAPSQALMEVEDAPLVPRETHGSSITAAGYSTENPRTETSSDSDGDFNPDSTETPNPDPIAVDPFEYSSVPVVDRPNKEKKGRKNIAEIFSDSDLRSDTQAARERIGRIQFRTPTPNSDVPPAHGRRLVNVDRSPTEAPVYLPQRVTTPATLTQHLAIIKIWQVVLVENSGFLLSLHMGLGKTMVAVTFTHLFLRNIVRYPHKRSPTGKCVFIVVPSSLQRNWMNEFEKWLGDEKPNIWTMKHIKKDSGIINKWREIGGVILFSHGYNKSTLPEEHIATIQEISDLVIVDEGHHIKDPNAVMVRSLNKIKTKRRIVMTGCPFQNHLTEYWCMINFIAPHYLGSIIEYRNQFVNPIENGCYEDSTEEDIQLRDERMNILQKLLEPITFRKSGEELKRTLPSHTDYAVYLNITEPQRRMYEEIFPKDIDGDVHQGSFIELCHASMRTLGHPEINRRHQEQPSADVRKEDGVKILVLLDIIRECEKKGDRVIVFMSSLSGLAFISSILHQEKIRFVHCKLGTTVDIAVQKFQEDTSKTVLLMMMKSGNVGHNIVGANHVVLFDLDWNPSNIDEAVGRIYRMGQIKETFVYRLIVAGTYDSILYKRSLQKQVVGGLLVDSRNRRSKTMKRELKMFEYRENEKKEESDIRGSILAGIRARHESWFHHVRLHEEASAAMQSKIIDCDE